MICLACQNTTYGLHSAGPMRLLCAATIRTFSQIESRTGANWFRDKLVPVFVPVLKKVSLKVSLLCPCKFGIVPLCARLSLFCP